ncbi:MAG: KTSC domain-containing protein [Symploca sp. SIO2B6]|nr:KTSC domain-containing protein [Symploca sp. SIO2B6]
MAMKKIDLSKVIAVGHRDRDNILEVLVEQDNEYEYMEVPAPYAAYSGLRDLADALDPDVIPIRARPIQLPAATTDPDVSDTVTDSIVASPIDIDMRPVRSTMASAVGYNQEQQVLQIEFKNGAIYQYEDVEPETWNDFWGSDSIGIVFNEAIRGHYASKRCK